MCRNLPQDVVGKYSILYIFFEWTVRASEQCNYISTRILSKLNLKQRSMSENESLWQESCVEKHPVQGSAQLKKYCHDKNLFSFFSFFFFTKWNLGCIVVYASKDFKFVRWYYLVKTQIISRLEIFLY